MSNSQIEEIKSRISIEDIVGDSVELQMAGKNLKGLCPFHNEKTPSFVVSPERGTYYCFGCGAKGDIFTYMQEQQGLEFKEVLTTLAARAGVTLDTFTRSENTIEDKKIVALEEATKFFEQNLLDSKEAKDYVIGRGISADTKNKFRIGYAPNDWHSLHTTLEKKEITADTLIEVGLAKRGEKGMYDHFRDRIMFPICDDRGKVIAFSGRLLHKDDKSAKYVNSPETPYFKKSEVFFGLNLARPAMRRKKEVILVEGQVDLVMAFQAGTEHVVATSGTAFTEQHADILKRYVEVVYIAFDGDMAGQKAAARTWNILLEKGLSVKIVSIPEKEDPADIILRSPERWAKLIQQAKPLIEYMTEKIFSMVSDSHKRIMLIEEKVLPKLKYVTSSIEKSYFVTYIAQKTGLSEDLLKHHTKPSDVIDTKGRYEKGSLEIFPIESELRKIIAWQESLPEEQRAIDIPSYTKKFEELSILCESTPWDNLSCDEETIFRFENDFIDDKDIDAYVGDLFKSYKKKCIKERVNVLSQKIENQQKGVGDVDEGQDQEQILKQIHKLLKESN